MTYRELLESGTARLRDAGDEDAETDARILFEHLTGMGRGDLLVRGDEEIPDGDNGIRNGRCLTEHFSSLIEERAGHKPVQYITGTADFMGLRFLVDENVLIPRFDTEFLVEEMLREVGDGSSVLDMCTGSGCILLSLMRYKNGIRGTGADISAAALDIAEKNEKIIFDTQTAMSQGVTEVFDHNKVEWIRSDLFERIEGRFDHIVCNPPYIKTAVIAGLMPEVRDHEPEQALDGGEDGLDFYRIIAGEAGKHLNRCGSLYLETGYDEGAEVSALLEENGFTDIQILKDYSGNDRVIKARMKQ